MVERLFGRERQLFATLEVTSVWPLKLKKSDLIINLTPRERAFYEKYVKKSPYEVKEIALATKQQASEKRWHLERRLRVTSSQAHRIKTRMCDFDALADKLAKPQPFTSAATTYGNLHEPQARQQLSASLRLPISQVGLVIHLEQPWLCCSPDGLISTDNSFELVEIKCPFSLKNNMLIDHEKQVSYVPYIHYIDGRLALKKSHQYYTQVMVMLYVLGLTEAIFFVHSEKHNISVQVERDDGFLAEVVPKLQKFYFAHLLPRLAKNS
ncbi:hypothetical protein MTO96_022641 [Rhipicephalus appendiculatus]